MYIPIFQVKNELLVKPRRYKVLRPRGFALMISSEVLVEQKTSLCVFFIIIIQPYSTDVVLTFSNGSDTSGISGYAINMISVPLGPLFEILVVKILLCHLLETKRISRTIISNDCGPAKQYEFYRY